MTPKKNFPEIFSAILFRRLVTGIALIGLGLVLSFSVNAQTPKKKAPKKGSDRIEMNFRNVDLVNFIASMSAALELAFIYDDKNIRGKITLISPKKFRKKDARKIFETVLSLHGYTTIRGKDSPVLQIVPMKEASRIPSQTRVSPGKIGQSNVFMTQIIPLQFADANQVKAALTPLISKSASLAVYKPANVIMLSDTEANIDRILNVVKELDIDPGDAEFKVIVLNYASARKLAPILTSLVAKGRSRGAPKGKGISGGFSAEVKVVAVEHTNSLIIVGDPATQASLQKIIRKLDIPGAIQDTGIKIYRLKHADAEEMLKILTGVKKGVKSKGKPKPGSARIMDVTISADKPTNSLIVFGPPETIETMDQLVKELDIRRSQVFVEALIMEMTLEKSLQLGVSWQATSPSGESTVGIGFPGATPQTLSQTMGRGSGSFIGVVGDEIIFQGQSFASFSAFIEATRQDQDLNILANPQILTLNNEEAEINVSQVIPISVKILRDANQNTTTEFEFKDVGIILKITPQITGNDKVRLIIDQESSSVASRSAGVSLEQQAITTLKRSLKTKVLVDNNSTIAIGGLIQDQLIVNVTKVPCLGDIPVLGWFFKSRSEEIRKTNLIIFIRPRIINTQEDLEGLSRNVHSRFLETRKLGSDSEGILKKDFGLEIKPKEEGDNQSELDETSEVIEQEEEEQGDPEEEQENPEEENSQ